jgi:hypothetical protein
MRSLTASTGLANVYPIIERTDTDALAAWDDTGATLVVVDPEVHTFAAKVNHGLDATHEPWLFLVGSDVVFKPGWLDHAEHAARITGANVVGTNDLGNPRVMRGEHATHLLVRRSYVDEVGASWDGPKVVCHEGYRHWYVDDEVVTAAKQRGTWAMALASHVEHLHPYWGKAATDDVYEQGATSAEEDRKLYQRRCRRNA